MGTKSTIVLYSFLWIAVAPAQSLDSVLVEEYSVGSFQHAMHVAVEEHGPLFILDSDQNQLSVFSDLQKPPKVIGGFGWSSGSFDRPTGVATDGIHIYVSDYGNHRIQRFDRNINYISTFSTRDTTDASSRFGYPLDVGVSELGDLFILDGENQRVLKFTPSYLFERSFGDLNAGRGRLQTPFRLAVTTSRLFVCEKNRIVVFDYFGNFLGSIGEGILSNLCGFTLLPKGLIAAANAMLWRFSDEGILQQSIPLNHLLSSSQIEQIQDVAYRNNQLYVLSLKTLLIFSLQK